MDTIKCKFCDGNIQATEGTIYGDCDTCGSTVKLSEVLEKKDVVSKGTRQTKALSSIVYNSHSDSIYIMGTGCRYLATTFVLCIRGIHAIYRDCALFRTNKILFF
jgi:hypothetical protein